MNSAMSHGGLSAPLPTAPPECFSWYFYFFEQKNWYVNNWIVYLKCKKTKQPIKTYQYAKEQTFLQRTKDFHRN